MGSQDGHQRRQAGKPNSRTVGRIYEDISTGGQWFWCLNDRAPSPAADRGYAPTRAKAMLLLKLRWIERGPHTGVDEEPAGMQACY